MKISILVDNQSSWIMPYANDLYKKLLAKGHNVGLFSNMNDLEKGDCVFFLGCVKIIPRKILDLNKNNLVIHESSLPKGRGWSPLTWQIIEGKNDIPITLFEAEDKVDSGKIYIQDVMRFEGHELVDELRVAQGSKTVELALQFIDQYPDILRKGRSQEGEETFYPRRRPQDSELEIDKSIEDLFNKFRVADNERYPTFFKYKGHTFTIKIEKRS